MAQAKPLLAVFCVVVLAITASGGQRFFSTLSLHPDPAAVPSTESAHAERYADAIATGTRLARGMAHTGNVPGLSVAVGIGGDVVWAGGFGWANLESRQPVTPDTRFQLGTASTLLTSAAVGLLLEKERLNLDEEIQATVPEFPRKRWPVTLRQLMGDTAGLSADARAEGPLSRLRCERPVEAFQHFGDSDLLFEPGTRYEYSTDGWILVSAAVEAVAGQPFVAFARDQIFQPLQMDHTSADSTREENPDHVGEDAEDPPPFTLFHELVLKPLGLGGAMPVTDRATYYVPRFGTDGRYGLNAMRPHNLSCYAGAMAFLSTPSDLVRFGLAVNGGRLLQAGTVQQLQTSQLLSSGEHTGHGLGWDLETITRAGDRTPAAGADGQSRGGTVASFLTFRAPDIVVVVMSNLSHAETSSLAVQIADAFAAKRAQ